MSERPVLVDVPQAASPAWFIQGIPELGRQCEACGGTGTCGGCGGTGLMKGTDRPVACPVCMGSGRCPRCS